LRIERIGLDPTLPDYLRWRVLGLHHILWQWYVTFTVLEAALTVATAWSVFRALRSKSAAIEPR
jgi:hypothetical protein